MKHSRNLHKDNYPLAQLVQSYPALQPHVLIKPDGGKTIDFANPNGVKALNAALLSHYYQVKFWDVPAGYLCPPVPGRADYVHYLADLLAKDNQGVVPKGNTIKGLDIGTGANVIYPIIATRSYGWQMVGTDIDPVSIKSGNTIIASNSVLTSHINVRQQLEPQHIFTAVVKPDEHFAFCMCNPPFHQSAEQAKAVSQRKIQNLIKNKSKRGSPVNTQRHSAALNFAGQSNELWCEGGERQFIQRMITESRDYANQIGWFSSLVSKKDNLIHIYKRLGELGISDVKTVEMAQGQKVSRFVAWRF
ncbi:23S rRNA (adenine(1618)-N(6))-methyltransferase RlmF [Paraglaciecola sp. MB-3u-78]|uniref:23S rRNA (adenine(1618)-N(6))-methyltransferase RlmF n=1 Tax=Paraglaciecola sp. MB-3u-78 TaxID=2058332 RepID=UPI000C338BEB|nr:23S rRNA (adenine(1618)-N(6))-methyltransferase RlmF [Paraglaciecola sp. MB-3u-78]PKG99094.1 23S rRNA (adenine(1618)-N(6))-methyltransferase RlmF [Paraglaciecola sp. MB-3u-78]